MVPATASDNYQTTMIPMKTHTALMKPLRSTAVLLFALTIVSFASPQSARGAITATLVIDGYEIGSFTELVGIVSAVEANDYWEADATQVSVKKLGVLRKPPTVSLRRQLGGSETTPIDQWHEVVATGAIVDARRNVSLTIFTDGAVTAKYWLANAWPSRVQVTQVDLGNTKKPNEVLMETVTLVCEYIQRVAP
jgi:phage tail-like protein